MNNSNASSEPDGVSFRVLELSDAHSWKDALERAHHGFAHTWQSCHAFAQTTGHATFLLELESPAGCALVALAERSWGGSRDLYSPYGFGGLVGAMPSRSAGTAYLAWAKAHRYVCSYLLGHPVFGITSSGSGLTRVRRGEVYLLDLRQPPDQLRRGLHANRRRDLQQTEGVLVEDARRCPDVAEFFVRLFSACHRERGAGSAYSWSEETLRSLVAGECVLLLGARLDGAVCAASLFGFTRHEATFLFNVATEAGRACSTRLLFEAARRLQSEGVPLLNLGGGVRPGDGVAEFKRRMGGRAVPLWDARAVHEPDRFSELCRRAHLEPNESAGYFPPYQLRK